MAETAFKFSTAIAACHLSPSFYSSLATPPARLLLVKPVLAKQQAFEERHRRTRSLSKAPQNGLVPLSPGITKSHDNRSRPNFRRYGRVLLSQLRSLPGGRRLAANGRCVLSMSDRSSRRAEGLTFSSRSRL